MRSAPGLDPKSWTSLNLPTTGSRLGVASPVTARGRSKACHFRRRLRKLPAVFPRLSTVWPFHSRDGLTQNYCDPQIIAALHNTSAILGLHRLRIAPTP